MLQGVHLDDGGREVGQLVAAEIEVAQLLQAAQLQGQGDQPVVTDVQGVETHVAEAQGDLCQKVTAAKRGGG